jgi:hypothetical protein
MIVLKLHVIAFSMQIFMQKRFFKSASFSAWTWWQSQQYGHPPSGSSRGPQCHLLMVA